MESYWKSRKNITNLCQRLIRRFKATGWLHVFTKNIAPQKNILKNILLRQPITFAWEKLILTELYELNDQITIPIIRNAPRKEAAIFFDMITWKMEVNPSEIISIQIISRAISKFWNEEVIPVYFPKENKFLVLLLKADELKNALKTGNLLLNVQMKFSDFTNQWRSMGSYTTWNIDQPGDFCEHLIRWINLQGNHYEESGHEVNNIHFSYKFLSDKDSVIKTRTNKLNASTKYSLEYFFEER